MRFQKLKCVYEKLSTGLIFPEALVERLGIKAMPSKLSDNIYGAKKRNPLSIIYLNNAFFWFKALKKVRFNGKTVTEIGPGSSLVIDLALNYMGFNGRLYKIDRARLKTPQLKRGFTSRFIRLNPIASAEKLPQSDAFVFNHSIDDLYISLCLPKSMDYFRFSHGYKAENKIWDYAAATEKQFAPQIVSFLISLRQKLKRGGFIIIRRHPSCYEVMHGMEKRIAFHQKLCRNIAKGLKESGFRAVRLKPAGMPGMFLVFRKI